MRYLLKKSPITFAMKETDNQARMHLLSNIFRIAVGCLMLTVASCGTAKLSVMSFNVRQSHAKEVNPNDSWDKRKEACLEMLQTRKPDLVGFQEAQFKGQWSFFRDSLASEYGSVGIGRDNGVDKGETSGFLYKKSVFTLLDNTYEFPGPLEEETKSEKETEKKEDPKELETEGATEEYNTSSGYGEDETESSGTGSNTNTGSTGTGKATKPTPASTPSGTNSETTQGTVKAGTSSGETVKSSMSSESSRCCSGGSG